METGQLAAIGLFVAIAAFIGGYMYLLLIWVKNWIYRMPMPPVCNLWYPTWLNRSIWRDDAAVSDYPSYFLINLVTCICLWVALFIVALCINYPVILLVVVTTALLVGGVFALRWMVDTKVAIGKVRGLSHDQHKTEKEE